VYYKDMEPPLWIGKKNEEKINKKKQKIPVFNNMNTTPRVKFATRGELGIQE
jgi:hypothetical protein